MLFKVCIIFTSIIIPISCLTLIHAEARNGVLRIHPTNSRYFTDDSGIPIYFAGSHTWNVVFPLRVFSANTPYRHPVNYNSFEKFLEFLQSYNHNFTRLWTGMSYMTAARWPWKRTGPGLARDGRPRFDMTRFDQKYFDILKERVQQVENRGLYASVMIFGSHNDFELNYENIAWHPDNNINDMGFKDGDSFFKPTHQGRYAQRLLVKKFVDTLNDFDNIIFEVMNEAPFPQSAKWQKDIVIYAKQYKSHKPKQHLWGITADYRNSNPYLLGGPHDWWSPDSTLVKGYDYRQGGPASYAVKPVIVDSDHFDGGLYSTDEISKGIALVWKTFTRGNHPILMECYNSRWKPSEFGCDNEVNHVFDPIRKALGHTRTYANRFVDLVMTEPSETLCSSKYCLINPGKDYLIYQPVSNQKSHSSFIVRGLRKLGTKLGFVRSSLTVFMKKGTYRLEWFDPLDESLSNDSVGIKNDGRMRFKVPFHIQKDAILYLKKTEETADNEKDIL